MTRRLPAAVFAVAGAVTVLLVALSGRYGYHRDELYFLACGRHLAWGYPDQPPFVPLVARAMSALAPGSLPALRLPSALAAGGVVVVTAAMARELGASRPAQVLASAVMATAAVLLVAAHLLSTTAFGLLAWSVVLWLVVHVLGGGDERWLAVAGIAAGVGLLANDLLAFLMFALLAGVVVAGPRRMLRSPWLWAGVAVAVACWSPYLVWQARHGWPQLTVGREIAAGGSGTSEPRWLLLPFQPLMLGPVLAPVWVVGLVRLLRSESLRSWRAVGVAWLVLVGVFTTLGGKPYYLAGMFPALVAAGAQPALAWVRGRRAPAATLTAALVASLPGLVIALPVVAAADLHRTPIVDLNYDAGETVGWPAYVAQVARVYRVSGARAVLAGNYGEAGAVDHYGARLGLPAASSGHNAYWWWGPPTVTPDATVVAVGMDSRLLRASFDHVRLATRLHNDVGLDNDEEGAPVWVCRGLRGTWDEVWPRFRRLG